MMMMTCRACSATSSLCSFVCSQDQARFLELQAVSMETQRQRQTESQLIAQQKEEQQKLLGKKGSRPKLAFGFGAKKR